MNVKIELAELKYLSPNELREKYLAVFGEPSRSGNKDYLIERIGWRIQSLAEGGLSERAKARAAEIARDADIRVTVPKVAAVPGAGVQHARRTTRECRAVHHEPAGRGLDLHPRPIRRWWLHRWEPRPPGGRAIDEGL